MMLKYPWLLLLFLIYLPIIYFYISRLRTGNPYVTVSTVQPFRKLGTPWRVWMMHFNFAVRLAAIGCIIVALCRPQTHDSKVTSEILGTDIVVALDVSASMETPDLVPNRFDAARKIASQFVEKRDHDNIGLVAFAGESLTYMPLTTDRTSVINAVSHLMLGSLGDGTAIGDGLVSATNRVLGGNAVSKSIILLTDGSNNAGEVDPLTAAQIAKQKGVRVYTIGIGRNDVINMSTMYGHVNTAVPIEIDEESLKEIARITGGQFFRATDNRALENVFAEIDKLEKSRINVDNFTRTDDNFMPWIGAALLLLVLNLLLHYTLLRKIP
ncbi:MAG: VWA domain-containing protein [Muribaculaceae bacterium]|nr:VWA domain-containing protein [Muribaculaceae bacterium]